MKKKFAFISFYLVFLLRYSVGGKLELIPDVLTNCLKSEKINFISFVFGQFATDNEVEKVVNVLQKNNSLFFGR